jgi:putrescine transport system permease protein
MKRMGGWALVLPYLWLAALFAAPFAIVAKMSLSQAALALPPYEPVFSWADGVAGWLAKLSQLSLDSYAALFVDSLYLDSYLSSLRLAAIATLCALLVAYPFSLAITRASPTWRPILYILAIAPFWTSFLIRVYAWIAILKDEGFLNHALIALGLIDEPLRIFATDWAVVIGIVYSYLPFMTLPIYVAIAQQEPALIEAAADLGASPLRAFWRVTFPLSLPGVLTGCLLVFIPAVGEFVIPDLLGGSDTLMIGRTMWVEFFDNRDWPTAAAAAIVLLLALLAPITLYERMQGGAAAGRA